MWILNLIIIILIIFGILMFIGMTYNLYMELFVYSKHPEIYSNYMIMEAEYLHKNRK